MKAFVLVGPPGAGKSTYAEKLAIKENAIVISGDDIRAELFGSASVQGNWGEIWERVEELVAEGCSSNIILDGTHCRKDYRAEAVTLLRSYGYGPIHAIVLLTSLPVCLERNAQRKRNVPEHVIEQMHNDMEKSLKTISDEDFDLFHFTH